MITLIKRDLLSTKNVWFFIVLALVVVWAFLTYIILKHPGEVVELLVIPAFLTVFFGYGLVAHVCRVEDLNRVNERILQLPVHHHVLILSRYLSSFLLVAILLLINLAFFAVLSFFASGSLFTFNEISTSGYLLFQLLTLIVSIYLPFYFAKSSNVATWSIRISVFLWLLYTFLLPLVYFNQTHGEFFDQYYDHLGGILFLFTLLIVPISFASSTSSYRLRRLCKGNLLPLAGLCLSIIIVFVGVAKIAESQSLKSVADHLMDTKVEYVKVEAIPAYQYDEGENPEQYRVLVTVEFSNDSVSENNQLVYTEPTIYVEVSGSAHDYLGLVSFIVPFKYVYYPYFIGGNHTYEIEAPNFLTEQEKDAFITNFTEEDFSVFIESKWLKSGRHPVDWRKR